MTAPRWLVVGLGNPPGEYAGTRHNVGAETVDALAERSSATLARNRKVGCRVVETRHDGQVLVLAVPEGYMNESGRPVRSAADWFKVGPERTIVVHDDLDLPVGVVRVKRGGGHGGHNGLRDLDRTLGTPDYLRVRIGIGRPLGTTEARDHVLRRASGPERTVLDEAIGRAADAVLSLVSDGLEATQNRMHAPGGTA
ncbi:MAG: hypothetical protein RLZZ272_751 [Actinomycetota bacterium]